MSIVKRTRGALPILPLCLVAAAALACSLPQAATPEVAVEVSLAPTATPKPPTPTPEPPTATSPSPTATAPPPTDTPEPTQALPARPTPAPEPAPARIQFAPGATSATAGGTIEPNEVQHYVLQAAAGQVMEVLITSPNDGVLLGIHGADGTVLKRSADDRAYWRGELPATQEYVLDAVAVGGATSYQLSVTIFARVQFEPGATSVTVTGSIEQSGTRHYAVQASVGQWMEVRIGSPQNDVLLTIWGEDGIPIKRYVDGQAEWRGEVYASQNYYIEAVSVGGSTDYTLTVTISPLGVEPKRIEFGPGRTWAVEQGQLESGATDRYVLRAPAGQGLYVSLASPNRDVSLGVRGADGQLLVHPETGTDFAAVTTLPASQDYVISVVPSGGDTPYTLRVSVAPAGERPARIQFEPGATSATVVGVLEGGGDHASYILSASAGQTMDITVVPAILEVGIWVEGQDGSVWRAPFGQNGMTLGLPGSQEYTITLFTPPGAGATNYAVDVAIY